MWVTTRSNSLIEPWKDSQVDWYLFEVGRERQDAFKCEQIKDTCQNNKGLWGYGVMSVCVWGTGSWDHGIMGYGVWGIGSWVWAPAQQKKLGPQTLCNLRNFL